MKKLLLIQLIISIGLFAQTTEVIKKTDIYLKPNKNKENILGKYFLKFL